MILRNKYSVDNHIDFGNCVAKNENIDRHYNTLTLKRGKYHTSDIDNAINV